MLCEYCGRKGLTEKELAVHTKYFHKSLHNQQQVIAQGVCPDCGSTLFFQEGCASCPSCGYSKCS